ncbi:MAG: ABC transporter ATP-binding protein [Rhodobiaceae bacterium]|nr:ABC transporter ATP-binding protein [Rhodobiaceae bacterium]MCC0015154.1 ABC transporter ATP-binding protein [Rhodobiaceae bacterium]MCC0040778.1 ABC transporter ATP-binding protein [Rhodobiaceae bacterium]MCC0053605.1 ABC transporter ATP-binding protein [Rhodobiaceae bacterium]
MAFLKLINLTKRFGDFVAVNDLSLDIEKGEFISLLGPSGCGKTTTLQMIAGLHDPSGGSIELEGRDLTHVPPNKRGLGIVFQSYALFPHLTAAENIAFGLEMRGVGRAERDQRVARALDQVHLASFADRHPKALSGGQRQRVALARALVIEPPVLLLDEPLSNLDAKLREEMQLELRILQQNIGVTTILVTHDQSEALSMSDRIVVMDRGRAIQIDTPLAMYEAPGNAFVSGFVGKTNLLAGEVTTTRAITVNGVKLAANASGLSKGAAVRASLRPEKIVLGKPASGLKGKVGAAVFHGSHWLYTLDTPLGDLIAVAPNTGEPPFKSGASVSLSWPDNALRVLPAESSDG